MNRPNFLCAENGKLILRLVLGLLMLLHGIDKITGGVSGLAGLLSSKGIPSFIVYGIYIGEVVAPLLMIVGYRARLGGLIVAFTMLAAVLLAHSVDVLTLNEHGGWGIELQGLYLFGGLAVACLGAGKYAVSSSNQWD
ncbi:MAG: DoxX family protein [Chitinophagales bacterium]